MTLQFPNPSRSYDPVSKHVRFVGHDGMHQVPFLVELAALNRLVSTLEPSEQSYLSAYDLHKQAIHSVALKAYSSSKKPYYILTARDFR